MERTGLVIIAILSDLLSTLSFLVNNVVWCTKYHISQHNFCVGVLILGEGYLISRRHYFITSKSCGRYKKRRDRNNAMLCHVKESLVVEILLICNPRYALCLEKDF